MKHPQLTRELLESAGYNTQSATDEDIRDLSDEVSDELYHHKESSFWTVVSEIIEWSESNFDIELPKNENFYRSRVPGHAGSATTNDAIESERIAIETSKMFPDQIYFLETLYGENVIYTRYFLNGIELVEKG